LDTKKIAAIGAAVSAFLEEEMIQDTAQRIPPPALGLRAWSQSGRQEIMRNRQLWQLRIVPRNSRA